jgi:hypothetical protein
MGKKVTFFLFLGFLLVGLLAGLPQPTNVVAQPPTSYEITVVGKLEIGPMYLGILI